MSTKRLVITGSVHGVGFRDWVVETATTLGLAGWVRNRADRSVELLIHGDADAVEEMQRACRRGPRHAEVTELVEHPADPPEQVGFHRLPTV